MVQSVVLYTILNYTHRTIMDYMNYIGEHVGKC